MKVVIWELDVEVTSGSRVMWGELATEVNQPGTERVGKMEISLTAGSEKETVSLR